MTLTSPNGRDAAKEGARRVEEVTSVLHAERRIPLHDGILERTLDEAEQERIAGHDFWARIAAARAVERGERVRNRPHRREHTRPGPRTAA